MDTQNKAIVRKSNSVTGSQSLVEITTNYWVWLNNILMNNAAMEDAKLQLATYVEKATNLLQEFHSVKNYELIELLLKLVKTLENTDR
ncbi:UNVERIFIED_CONTAM: hypothetical protein NCL1_29038 [Trichonephila clavipes]